MKKLYSFTINKTEEVEEKVDSVNESGAQVITINKVKKEVPHKFCLIKPSRNMRDEGDLFYGSQYGNAVKNGMIPFALLQKRFEDDDGTISKKTQEKYEKLIGELYEKNKEYNKILLILESDRTEEEKQKLKELAGQISVLQLDLKSFQVSQVNLYNTTPEVYARNKTIIWYLLNLSYKDNEKLDPFFGEGDKDYTEQYEKRSLVYEGYEDLNDPFINKVIPEFLYFTAVYYNNNPSNQEEFEKILAELKKQESNEPAVE